ncbi:uncharacterized protein [Eleutherodactylus coqui]|uniref:uncharacterized protein n=1 Tax=Eleutherodactylus coqui TaxID=57060 RepID=UPI003462596A
MAYYLQYSSHHTEDIWREETLPGFQEVALRSQDQPLDGKIYVMYHGTTYPRAVEIILSGFIQSKDGMLGSGVYVSRDINKAQRYPLLDKTDQVVLKLRVNVGRVKKIEYQSHPMQKSWHENGYDTAWVPAFCSMVKSGLEEDCVWDPRRIKVVDIAKAPAQYLSTLEVMKNYRLLYSPRCTEDIWREETLPEFQEVALRSQDQPLDGKIYVMYHGTTCTAAAEIIKNGFMQSKDGMLGSGVYVSRDINKAQRYPLLDKTNQVVLKLRVNVGRVKKIEYQNHPMQKTWHDNGYDTAWVPAFCTMEEDCVWDPRRIKVVGIAIAPPQDLQNLHVWLALCRK